MKRMLLPGLLACLVGCASAPPPAVCITDKLAWGIGRQADAATVRELYIQSGTGLWRIETPGQVLKQGYQPDRLTIHVDAKNTITGFTCG